MGSEILTVGLDRKFRIKAHSPEFLFSQVLACYLHMGQDGQLTGLRGIYFVDLGRELPELNVLHLSL